VGGHSLFSTLIDHAYHAFGLFIAVPEVNPFYNPGIPLLDHGMNVLFVLSLVLLLLNWRKIEYVVLLLWVGGTALFGGFLLRDFPQSPRYVIAAPALCILVSLALVQIYSLLSQTGRLLRWLSMAVISVTVFAIMIWNIFFYFGDYTWRNCYGDSDAITEIADYLHPQAGTRYVYMFAAPYFYLGHGTIKFVGQDPAGTDVIDPLVSATALPDPAPGLKPLFIFVPERLGELEIVKQRYPNGQLQEYRFQPANVRPSIYIYEPGN
jgi:hypothetical protein